MDKIQNLSNGQLEKALKDNEERIKLITGLLSDNTSVFSDTQLKAMYDNYIALKMNIENELKLRCI